MVDLYASIGAERSDPPDVIRKKYRKAAKQAHPDAGGSREKFATVSTALAVLTDPDRRRYYDETGKVDAPGPDTKESKAMEMAMAELTKVIAECEQRRMPLEETDLLGDAKEGLLRELENNQSKMEEVKKYIKTAGKLASRFSARKGKPNRITPMIEAWRAEHERTMAKGRNLVETIERAVAILDEHTFKIDPRSW